MNNTNKIIGLVLFICISCTGSINNNHSRIEEFITYYKQSQLCKKYLIFDSLFYYRKHQDSLKTEVKWKNYWEIDLYSKIKNANKWVDTVHNDYEPGILFDLLIVLNGYNNGYYDQYWFKPLDVGYQMPTYNREGRRIKFKQNKLTNTFVNFKDTSGMNFYIYAIYRRILENECNDTLLLNDLYN